MALFFDTLLSIPANVNNNLDPRLFEQLNSTKNLSDVYMASSFILNQIVKPIGVLIGEDVLSSRLGISKSSSQWNELCELLEAYKYTGCFSSAYKRWWAIGVELWWAEKFKDIPSLKRLTAGDRCQLIKNQFNLQLKPIEDEAQRTWNICNKEKTPIDPIMAFEVVQEESAPPWQDKSYYSFNALVESAPILKLIKDFDREWFKSKAQEEKE